MLSRFFLPSPATDKLRVAQHLLRVHDVALGRCMDLIEQRQVAMMVLIIVTVAVSVAMILTILARSNHHMHRMRIELDEKERLVTGLKEELDEKKLLLEQLIPRSIEWTMQKYAC